MSRVALFVGLLRRSHVIVDVIEPKFLIVMLLSIKPQACTFIWKVIFIGVIDRR